MTSCYNYRSIGLLQEKNAILKAKENFLSKANSMNWKLNYNSISKLVGKDGNEEEFFYFSKK
jgi:23S rRNA (cytidine1920-2'-O)/16S rRNA (cytidine1409-2'-O)-methyltransferase